VPSFWIGLEAVRERTARGVVVQQKAVVGRDHEAPYSGFMQVAQGSAQLVELLLEPEQATAFLASLVDAFAVHDYELGARDAFLEGVRTRIEHFLQ
jgi:hypothetical protein